MNQMRESKESPSIRAFCRVAPSVLFNDRAIFPAGVLLRASAFNVRTCSDVHTRRFPFGLAIFSPSDQKRSLVAARTTKEKINFRIVYSWSERDPGWQRSLAQMERPRRWAHSYNLGRSTCSMARDAIVRSSTMSLSIPAKLL